VTHERKAKTAFGKRNEPAPAFAEIVRSFTDCC
jgi:hypothetical protein